MKIKNKYIYSEFLSNFLKSSNAKKTKKTRPLQISQNDNTIIKQIMHDKGITIDELATRMGRAKTTIVNQLKLSNMTISSLAAIAKALDVEIADLFPVPDGYVHYEERRKSNMLSMQKQNTENVTKDEFALFCKFKEFMKKKSSSFSGQIGFVLAAAGSAGRVAQFLTCEVGNSLLPIPGHAVGGGAGCVPHRDTGGTAPTKCPRSRGRCTHQTPGWPR